MFYIHSFCFTFILNPRYLFSSFIQSNSGDAVKTKDQLMESAVFPPQYAGLQSVPLKTMQISRPYVLFMFHFIPLKGFELQQQQ